MLKSGIKIGVLIPTRGDREIFIKQAIYLLSKQTLGPFAVELMDDKPVSEEIDITYRYRIGCQRLFNKGCDVIIFWEDDDWYSRDYIQTMVTNWELHGRPSIFGIGVTTYYHISALKHVTIMHKERASAMSTMVTKEVLKIQWGKDADPYTDIVLWKQMKGKAFLVRNAICLGIKHNFGLCGGGGHDAENFAHYNQSDPDKSFLKGIVGEDFEFYDSLPQRLSFIDPAMGEPYKINGENISLADVMAADPFGISLGKNTQPFLTIITRKYKRPVGLSKNIASIKALTDQDYEQIFIEDTIGKGLYEANRSFQDASPAGKFVFLLDDDDYITNPNMITELKEIVREHDPDVIFFRMIIKNNMNGNYYPTTELCWGNRPVLARIGGSCFVVKNEIYRKFIHNFAHPRCGDFYFINAVYESGAKCYWHDVQMCETGRVSHGKPEEVN